MDLTSKQPTQNNAPNALKSLDCIYRQAAIDHWRSIIDATDGGDRYDMGFNDGLEFCISDLSTMPSAQPKIEERNGKSAQNVSKEDLISRKAAIDALNGVIADYIPTLYGRYEALPLEMATAIKRLPTVEPTLYGYKIEHLAYIARVMQKESVTAEYAVRTFGDISRASRMIIEELQEKVEKSLSAMQLPSAEPERKTGRWIHKGGGSFICSDCGEMVGLNTYRSERAGEIFRYCPHCGAYMGGEEDGSD